MNTKLTLKLDQQVIEKAKAYASDRKQSLSRLVESYLQSLTSLKNIEEVEISPFVRSMSTGRSLPIELDIKKEFADYIAEKHK